MQMARLYSVTSHPLFALGFAVKNKLKAGEEENYSQMSVTSPEGQLMSMVPSLPDEL
jgi:hypothetical protein